MPFSFDPETGAGLQALMGGNPPPPKAPVGDVEARRQAFNGLLGLIDATRPAITDVETKDFTTKASDGHEILLRWYTKKGAEAPGSAVYYTHGGGMIALALSQYDEIIKSYVSYSGVPFLGVDYRLAPEVQAPVLVEDVYAGYEYLVSKASELGVDPKRIAIMGDSAGGGLTAALAHLIKQKGANQPARQILVYPMLDDRNVEEHPEIAPYAVWTTDDNKTAWGAVLGDRMGTDKVKIIDAPGRMTVDEARGLPSTYIDVGQLDIFVDEDLAYAQTLHKAGVDCDFHIVPSVPHAFEGLCLTSKATQATMGRRITLIASL